MEPFPVIIVNFKNYPQSIGESGKALAKILERAAEELRINIILAVSPVEVHAISEAVSLDVFSEHVDHDGQGAHTGKITPEDLLANGARGVLINHSEDPEHLNVIEEAVRACRALGLQTIVCVPDAEQAATVAPFRPDFIAVEPPELISSEVASIATARPELIQDTVEAVSSITEVPVLCGAGVKSALDTRISFELGAQGILVASAVVKSPDPATVIKDFVVGFALALEAREHAEDEEADE
ncbi:MAG: triose-phosphate isomerase [Candidatus Woesearchaeota archaeon]|nr:MAG: triose-phosphate isomerase [Candidatus Woesearchaeota archaeon]